MMLARQKSCCPYCFHIDPGKRIMIFLPEKKRVISSGSRSCADLERDSSLSGSDDNKEMVLVDRTCQMWQFIPVFHLHIVCPYIIMSVPDIFIDKRESFYSTVKCNSTFKVAGYPYKPFHPTIESLFIFSSGRYHDLNAPDGIERLEDTCHDDLPVESVKETLMEFPQSVQRHLCVCACR